jgi:hypothetical protein
MQMGKSLPSVCREPEKYSGVKPVSFIPGILQQRTLPGWSKAGLAGVGL